jgi:hypothetical protein
LGHSGTQSWQQPRRSGALAVGWSHYATGASDCDSSILHYLYLVVNKRGDRTVSQQFSEPIELLDTSGVVTFSLNNQTADATFGGNGKDGDIYLRDSADRVAIHLNGNAAKIALGTSGNEGDVAVRDDMGRDAFVVSGHHATCYIGTEGNEGDLFIRDSAGQNAFQVNGHFSQVTVGNTGNPAQLRLTDNAGRYGIEMSARHAVLNIGVKGNEGDLRIRDNAGRDALVFDGKHAALYLGATNNEGDLRIRNNAGDDTIRLDGQSGDIELLGADCAEDFDTTCDVAPGTVMVITDAGTLEPSHRAYDPRVAGVISGAGDYAPGITLDKKRGATGRQPLALIGKVHVWVDADVAAVSVGDLLTTSRTPGHAMLAADRERAFGTVLGKALGRLERGRGLVPILVALQ